MITPVNEKMPVTLALEWVKNRRDLQASLDPPGYHRWCSPEERIAFTLEEEVRRLQQVMREKVTQRLDALTRT